MADALKAGDLFYVAHYCCGVHLGEVFTAERFIQAPVSRCIHCRRFIPTELGLVVTEHPFAFPLAWVRRIPPLSELQTTNTTEEITA